MKRLFLFTFLFLAMIVSGAFADVVSTDGLPNSSGIYPVQVDSDRVITFATDAGFKQSYETATTNDTITAAESGKTFIVDPSTADVTFNLPDADVGMSFTFVASNGNGAGTKKFVINPQDTDYLRGVVNSGAATTFAVGDSAISPGSTGDSITVFCGEDLYWDVVGIRGTFVDNN